MFCLYARYALSQDLRWDCIDDAASFSAIMEAMKHPRTELLDDTLLCVSDGSKTVAFGLVKDQQGFVVPPPYSFPAFSELSGKYFDKRGFDWDHAWNQCSISPWMMHLAAHTKTAQTLLVQAACDCAELALQTPPVQHELPVKLLHAVRQWVVDGSGAQEILNLKGQLAVAPYAINKRIACVRWAANSVEYPQDAAMAVSLAASGVWEEAERYPDWPAIVKKRITLADVLRNITQEIDPTAYL